MLSKPDQPNLFMQEAHLVGIETVRSFHMPGHSKNNKITPVLSRHVESLGLLKMDGTTDDTFGGLGNYFPASGSVRLSQEEAALLYGTKACFFMVQGSTGSIIGSMRFFGGKECHALIQRNSHRSIVHGLRISGARISTVKPAFNSDFTVFEPITLRDIQDWCDHDHTINLVVITSPTYEGLAADIRGIAQYCLMKGIKLVVDGAHSSVFPFAPEHYPPSGIGMEGVDLVVQSLHKGAGSLTQASIVHLNKTSKKSAKMLENALYVSTTTSPSSLILLSIEETIQSNFKDDVAKERIHNTVKRAKELRAQLKGLSHVQILEAEDPRLQDPQKLCIRLCNAEQNTEVSGRQIRDHFINHNIDPETYTPNSCLLTIGLGSTDEDAQMVFDAVAQLASDQSSFSEVNKIMLGTNDKLPDLVYELTLDECYNKDTEEVSIKDAVGLISLEIKSPCPPGCIVLDIGQIITEEHLQFFHPSDKVTVCSQHRH